MCSCAMTAGGHSRNAISAIRKSRGSDAEATRCTCNSEIVCASEVGKRSKSGKGSGLHQQACSCDLRPYKSASSPRFCWRSYSDCCHVGFCEQSSEHDRMRELPEPGVVLEKALMRSNVHIRENKTSILSKFDIVTPRCAKDIFGATMEVQGNDLLSADVATDSEDESLQASYALAGKEMVAKARRLRMKLATTSDGTAM
eukprot:TRINITY_DN14383_c0_g1_i1.p1 TRINITY_DN14383_c0_g1~~TRINITY_DN14383_c0_g1_i1.p1  ORF type:complete len:200 (-),score=19.56 TRINITY_DN14383_c0_g1_i1:458-1057(-)